MKSISVLDNTHKCIMDRKDSEHKSADAVIIELINSNNNLKQTVDRLMEDIRSFQLLDATLQSDDLEEMETAESI